MVLGILYESFIHPITIISGLPSAGIGALLTLILFRMDLSVIAMIGIVMLVGIVKKNAIMMVDFAIERRRVGLGAEAAIREACLLRFRPIMMTTFAAIFGALPIALGGGEGAELRQPLGVAVVGGLMLSQLLTLFITPVIYLYLDRIDRMLKRRLEPQLEEVPSRRTSPRSRRSDPDGLIFIAGAACCCAAGRRRARRTGRRVRSASSFRSAPAPRPIIVPRIVFDQLSPQLGQPIVVENRGGAGGTLGTARGRQGRSRRLHAARAFQRLHRCRPRSTRICPTTRVERLRAGHPVRQPAGRAGHRAVEGLQDHPGDGRGRQGQARHRSTSPRSASAPAPI